MIEKDEKAMKNLGEIEEEYHAYLRKRAYDGMTTIRGVLREIINKDKHDHTRTKKV